MFNIYSKKYESITVYKNCQALCYTKVVRCRKTAKPKVHYK